MVIVENRTQVPRFPDPQTGCFTAKSCWHQGRHQNYCSKELFRCSKEDGYRLDSHNKGAVGSEHRPESS